MIIMYDMVLYLGRNEILNTKDNEFNIVAILLPWHERPAAARLTWPAGNLKIALSEKIALLLHLQYTFRAVWLLHNLTLDGKLCLRNDKNAAFV